MCVWLDVYMHMSLYQYASVLEYVRKSICK